ncbi:MAG: hypothetical protein HY778_10055 [Betaproteobacteria bacterium]|nr:hypothetical protein [Betaproteobacteria bacterium]
MSAVPTPWLLVLALAAGCGQPPAPAVPPAAPSASSSAPAPDATAAFLARHWARPLPPQGAAPPHFSPLEADLEPAACGTCHVEQYRDWQGSLHAAAMGPGLLGQLVDMAPEARDEHQDCIRCHAPLAEQADSLAQAIAAVGGRKKTGGLHQRGLVCAACHVRGREHFGPPRRAGTEPPSSGVPAPRSADRPAPPPAGPLAAPSAERQTPPADKLPAQTSTGRPIPPVDERPALPHGGWSAAPAFEDSRFCAACHQFDPDGYALNGKLLENTYEEWKASPQAAAGQSCQSCHMPGRRHLWRGVHDAQTMRAAVTVEVTAPALEQGTVHAALVVRNTGTGHHFPTYVTPRVVAEIFQEDARGRAIPDTRAEHVIQRQVSPDLSREIADTRLAPGAQAVLDYRRARSPGAVRLAYRLRVEPDHFYTGLYESLLTAGAGRGAAMIREALTRSRASHFTFLEERRALP